MALLVGWLKHECHAYIVMLTTKLVLAKALYVIYAGYVILQLHERLWRLCIGNGARRMKLMGV